MTYLNLKARLPLTYLPDAKILLAAGLYYVSAVLAHSLAFNSTSVLPAWPPSGVAFALIILLGRSSWPGVAIGALLANLMGFWNNLALDQTTLISISSSIALGLTLETITGHFFVKRWIKDDYPFKKTKDTFRFLFVALLITMIGSSVGTVTLYLNGILTPELVLESGLRWWAGSVVGILLFTPFILSVAQTRSFSFTANKGIEGGIFAICILSFIFFVRSGYFNGTLLYSLPYLVIPFLLWLAFRFDLLAAMAVVLATSLLFIIFTIQGIGPFIQAQADDSMLLLQIFISVISISTLVVSATVAERSAAQAQLKVFNQNLEGIVHNRTKELNEEIETRREAEDKLVNTNKELSKRNTELDNFVYSVSHDLRAPIASVLGLINLATKDDDLQMKNVYLEKINKSAVQQDNFIREILDQSRNSRLELRKEEIHFEPLIQETFDQLAFATATGTPVEKIISVKQASAFYNDRWRLKVILNNVISNAIRYRNGRDPIIKVNVVIQDHTALLEIEDNGRGIPTEHLEKVCQMFYRATDDGAGSGLGLYIVKEVTEKLQGKIDITSEDGKWTRVTLEIPEFQ
jgi:signal transduction histidine kinase